MPQLEIPFRQWLPDQPDLNNPGLVEAKNVFLRSDGYQPIRDASSGSGDALDWEKEFGLYGLSPVYLYTHENTIYSVGTGGFIVTSFVFAPDANYEYADFARFGDSVYIVAADGSLDSLPGSSAPHDLFKFDGSSFSAVSGNIPAGTSIARVGNQLVMGRVDDSGYNDFAIRLSGYNQPDIWEPSELTQANIAEMEQAKLGPVIAVVGGVAPMIFQSEGITRINYVGPPLVLSQRLIWSRPGPQHPNAIVQVGNLYYFVTQEGAWVTDGSSVQSISDGSVSRWISGKMTNRSTVVYGSYHRDKKAIVWGIGGGSTEPFAAALVYSLETRAFSEIDGNYYGSARGELIEERKDVRAVVPQSGVLSNSKLTDLSGSTLEATLTTGHISNAGSRAFVDQVEPQYIGSGATVALSAKQRLRDNASFSSYVAEETTTGIADIRAEGRAVATSMKFPASSNWSDFTGVVADASEAGKR